MTFACPSLTMSPTDVLRNVADVAIFLAEMAVYQQYSDDPLSSRALGGLYLVLDAMAQDVEKVADTLK